jgi:hypothetical protein
MTQPPVSSLLPVQVQSLGYQSRMFPALAGQTLFLPQEAIDTIARDAMSSSTHLHVPDSQLVRQFSALTIQPARSDSSIDVPSITELNNQRSLESNQKGT